MKRHVLFIYFFVSGILLGQNSDVIKQIDDNITVLNNASYENGAENKEAELTDLYYQSKEINYEKGQLDALLLLCKYYISRKEKYDEVIDKGKIAEKIAIETDSNSLPLIRSYLGIAFAELGLVDEGKKFFFRSIKDSKNISNQEQKNVLNYKNYKYLAQYYQQKQNRDSAFFYLRRVLQASGEISKGSIFKNDYIVESHLRMAEFYIQEKALDKAKNHLNAASKIDKNSFLNADFFFLMGKIALFNKYEDSSLNFYFKADSLASKIHYPSLKAKIYGDIADYYHHKNELKKQIYYLKLNSEIRDSINKVIKSQINKINLNDYEEHSFFTRNLIYILSLIIIFSVVFFNVYVKNRHLIKKISLPILKKYNDVPSKNPISISELTCLAHENDPSFYIKFKEVFSGFEDKILRINPSLKPLDLEICAFIKLNFTTKQIATIKNISVRAVEGRKYRIRKALYISQDDNMYVWMSKI